MPLLQERDLSACIGAIYDAASGHAGWLEVGTRLRVLLQAETAVMPLQQLEGRPVNALSPPDTAGAAYAAYYHSVDPYRLQGQADFATSRARQLRGARLGPDVVPEATLLASEYFADYARRHGRRHFMGGLIGTRQPVHLGLFRPDGARPFSQEDCRTLDLVLPHLQRALELHERLNLQAASLRITMGALDAVPIGIVLVDAGSRVRFANAAAIRACGVPGAGIAMLASGPRVDAGTYLTARHRDDANALRRLVADAARGQAGGGLRIRPRETDAERLPMQAALVMPAPPAMLGAGGPELPQGEGGVLVLIEDLARRAPLPGTLLCDLFGFSRSEAEVAVALMGGATAEDVAMGRHVSIDTVRSQIRSVLRKSEATNLRDFEGVLATLALVAGGTQDRQAGRPRGLIDIAL